jgi:hypothetical protein
VSIAGVRPLRKNEPDRLFDDRIKVERCYLSHLDDSLMIKGEEGRKHLIGMGSVSGFQTRNPSSRGNMTGQLARSTFWIHV